MLPMESTSYSMIFCRFQVFCGFSVFRRFSVLLIEFQFFPLIFSFLVNFHLNLWILISKWISSKSTIWISFEYYNSSECIQWILFSLSLKHCWNKKVWKTLSTLCTKYNQITNRTWKTELKMVEKAKNHWIL